jgi:dTMP kinase
MTSLFVALEGPKCVGKTTLLDALRQRIRGLPQEGALLTKEPTPQFSLKQESDLLGADLASAIARDRAGHVREVIQPALDAGRAVICDRYILSSLVFHCGDGVAARDVWDLNRGFPLPDVNLLLSAPPGILARRREARASPTRLEAASDPAAETERYLHYGREMINRGVPLKIIPSETPHDRDQAVELLMRSVIKGILP